MNSLEKRRMGKIKKTYTKCYAKVVFYQFMNFCNLTNIQTVGNLD